MTFTNGGAEAARTSDFGTSDFDPCSGPPSAESILEEAQRITRGDRNRSYGNPAEDWGRIAEFWTAANRDILRPGCSFTAERGLLMMVLMKASRELNRHKRDNLVDVAGYADCIARVASNG